MTEELSQTTAQVLAEMVRAIVREEVKTVVKAELRDFELERLRQNAELVLVSNRLGATKEMELTIKLTDKVLYAIKDHWAVQDMIFDKLRDAVASTHVTLAGGR